MFPGIGELILTAPAPAAAGAALGAAGFGAAAGAGAEVLLLHPSLQLLHHKLLRSL
mgnify:CR=1 FL=1